MAGVDYALVVHGASGVPPLSLHVDGVGTRGKGIFRKK